jgi:hypothetical protein
MDAFFSAPPSLPAALAWAILCLTAMTLGALISLGLHRMRLLLLSRRPAPSEAERWEGELPSVTVQLPVYNEAGVVERLLDAAARLEYPRDLLQIQLLDDSTDETSSRATRRIEYWRERGVDVAHLRRSDRTGFKAGALAQATPEARGEFILILDADFVPAPDLLKRLLPPFSDPEVGMVQARWDHLNEGASLLTRCQALLLDAHFFFEQGGRYAGRLFMSFNGTAGLWRRRALDEAGGWSWDTLTEDLDVSYRCQMNGWRFVFLPQVGVPAELPGGVRALEVQQKRWAQGGIQTGKKILPRLLSSDWPLRIKVEGVVHLLGHLAHPLTLLLGLLLLPSALARETLGLQRFLFVDLAVLAGATLSFLTVYLAAGRRRGRPLLPLVPRALATLGLGVGLTASVSRAVGRGLAGGRDPFLRTPKRGDGRTRYRAARGRGDGVAKAIMAGWMLLSAALAVLWGYLATLPFILLFASGYLWLLLAGNRGGEGPRTSDFAGLATRVRAASRDEIRSGHVVDTAGGLGAGGSSPKVHPGAGTG